MTGPAPSGTPREPTGSSSTSREPPADSATGPTTAASYGCTAPDDHAECQRGTRQRPIKVERAGYRVSHLQAVRGCGAQRPHMDPGRARDDRRRGSLPGWSALMPTTPRLLGCRTRRRRAAPAPGRHRPRRRKGLHVTRRWTLLLALLVLAISACTNDGGGTKAAPGGTTTGPTDLTTALLAIEQGPRYEQSDWGYVVLDQKTGEVLASQSPVRDVRPRLDDEDVRRLRRARALRQRLHVPHAGVPGRDVRAATRWTETSSSSARVT